MEDDLPEKKSKGTHVRRALITSSLRQAQGPSIEDDLPFSTNQVKRLRCEDPNRYTLRNWNVSFSKYLPYSLRYIEGL